MDVAVIGVILGVVLGVLVKHFTHGILSDIKEAKRLESAESNSPYDYALQNAKELNKILSSNLSTIRETKRLEEQNMRMQKLIDGEFEDDSISDDPFRRLGEQLAEAENRRQRNLQELGLDIKLPEVPHNHDVHIIGTGDTLTSIASKYGISANKLLVDNEIRHPRDLAVGNTLLIKKED